MSKVRVLSDILDANNDLDITRLKSSGVTAGSYGSAANVPVITIDAYGRITAAANTAVAGVSAVDYDTVTGIYKIETSAGTSYPKDLGIGTADSPSFTGLTVTNTITGNIATSAKWATARTLALTGAVTGSQSIDGSGNVSITTTATADPTLTLTGDATGSATFTNLGNASLAVTISDDSHNHVIANVDGLQGALDAKAPLASPTFTGTPAAPTASLATNTTQLATTAFVRAEVTALINGAPSTMDTLKELADAVAAAEESGDINTLNTLVGTKLSLSGGAMTGAITTNSTFDGVDIAVRDAILTSTTTTAGAALPKAGGAMTGNVSFADNAQIKLGSGDDLLIYHDGSNSYIKEVGSGNLYLRASNLIIEDDNGTDYLTATADAETKLYHNGSQKFDTQSGGIGVSGNIVVSGTVDGIDIAARDAILTSTTTTAGAALPKAGGTMTGNLNLGDSNKLQLGASQDLQIFHDGANSYIDDAGTGEIKIRGNAQVQLMKYTGEAMLYAKADGPVEIYYDNAKKFETTSSGVSVTGELNVSTKIKPTSVELDDNQKLLCGNSSDLQIYHDGSNSYVKDVGVGNMYLMGENLFLDNADGTKRYVACTASTGEVGLYYSNVEKIKTASDGVSVTGKVYADGIRMDDSEKIQLGNSYDLEIFHDGTHSYVSDVGTGDLTLKGTNVALKSNTTDEYYIYCGENASVTLYYNNVAKLTTENAGVNVTGNLVATGNVTAYSDERLKDDIRVIPNALSKVEEIRGVTFTRNDLETDERFSGVIAQEVEAVLPEVVHESEGGMKTVDYGNMVGLLIEGMKEQQEIIRSLATRIEDLEFK